MARVLHLGARRLALPGSLAKPGCELTVAVSLAPFPSL